MSGDKTNIKLNNETIQLINQENHKHFSLGFVEMIPSPRLNFVRGVFLANHFASTDNLAKTTKIQNT